MDTYQHKVQYYETDKMGIVHHSNYIRWMEEARTDFLSKIGWDYKKLEDMGMISPVTAVACKYKHSTTYGDAVDICVWVDECKGVRLKIGYEMKNQNGLLVFEGTSEHCFLDRDGKIISLKRQYPQIFSALMQSAEK